MPTLAAGSKDGAGFDRIEPARAARPGMPPLLRQRLAAARGFTMIELLVVMAIIAIATAGVSLALRDSAASQLEREAVRLAALFEAARAQSRSTGQPVTWRPTEAGFRFDGELEGSLPEAWLTDTVRVGGAPVLLLGPEPIIGPQEVVLFSTALPDRSVRVATGGVRPFRIAGEGSP